MTGSNSFVRKIIYFVLIVVLLVPLYLISHPATLSKGGQLDEGGMLAKMRTENSLSQANLGEIDPAGASMSLATLGMRGVAANLLWSQAIKYKKTENWDGLKATLNQITKLQPNFESVWVFQAWNLSYNVSVEFDDYRHRYHWIKKGIRYLIDGTRFNRMMPSLLHEVGWFFQHKIGRADEQRQYRELFRNDDDFHAELDEPPIDMEMTNGPEDKPDNWLVAHEWYRAGETLVETRDAPIRRKNPLLFYSNAAMTLMYYCDAIQKEGHINKTSQAAWSRANDAWKRFGNRGIPSRLGFDIRLNDLERMRELARKNREKLNSLVPGAEEKIRNERMAALPKEMREAYEIPRGERNPEQTRLANQARSRVQVSLADIALQASPDNIGAARRFAKQAYDTEAAVIAIERERQVINFEYWMARTESEQTDNTIAARKHMFNAERYADDTDLVNARKEYEKAFELWAKIYERFPTLIEDVDAEDNYEAVKRYARLLARTDETFPPPDFPLMKLLDYYDDSYLNKSPDSEKATSEDPSPDSIPIEPADTQAAEASEAASTEAEQAASKIQQNVSDDEAASDSTDDRSESADGPVELPFGAAPDDGDQ